MVVLAASVVTKTGKALVSRQFVDMSRIRIEGLLAAFPKLVGSGKQHTYVETENVRYVYQPMEGLYLLLVTNKASNILEDLETLRLLAKVVPEYVAPLDEDAVQTAAFELLFAFDEVISLGYKEHVTVQQVKQNTEMESHEEKLHKMIIQSKINDTKDVMKRKAMEIDKSKIERARDGKGSAGNFVPSGGISSGMGGGGRSGGLGDDSTPTYSRPEAASAFASSKPEAARPKKGMQLGKAKKANDFLDSLRAEGEVVESDLAPVVGGGGAASTAGIAQQMAGEPVSIVVEEKLLVSLNKDGGVENMEVQGIMSLQVMAEEDACIRVRIETGDNAGFQFKTHPNIDKALYGDSLLGLKDPERPFPIGNPLGILKWRFETKDEARVPLTINCWPSVSGGDSYVNIEYEAHVPFDLQNVVIAIPCHTAPRVNEVNGDHHYDARKGLLLWTIDLIDKTNSSGAMEFVASPAAPPDSFFPVEVSFQAAHTLAAVRVAAVTATSDGQPVRYASKSVLLTDDYHVA